MAFGLHLLYFSPNYIVVIVPKISLLGSFYRFALATFGALGGDDGLGGDADSAVVDGEVVAGEAVGPGVSVAEEDGLAAGAGSLADGLAGLDGLLLEVEGADGRVHGAQEEEQVGAALHPQQPLELLHRQHRVRLSAVVQVVRHLRHVPGQRLAQRDTHRLAGRALRGAPLPHQHQHQQHQHRSAAPQHRHRPVTAAAPPPH